MMDSRKQRFFTHRSYEGLIPVMGIYIPRTRYVNLRVRLSKRDPTASPRLVPGEVSIEPGVHVGTYRLHDLLIRVVPPFNPWL